MDSILNYIDDIFPNARKQHQESYIKKMKIIEDLKTRIVANIDDCINLDEIERLGLSKLDINAISYYISGANSEITLKRNRKFFNRILLNQKILKNVSNTTLETEILGKKISLPICISPTAIQKMAHEDGELATARSALKNNTIMILSSLSSSSLEDVGQENKTGIRWFQLYAMIDRSGTLKIIKEAENQGFSAIVLTVDAPIMGYRDRDFQVKMVKPEKINYEIQKKVMELCETRAQNNSPSSDSKSDIFNFFKNNIDSSLTWEYLVWLRKQTKLNIILKGVLNSEDALLAAEYDIDGIIVSNHGGRQLDTVPSTIEVLEYIKDIVDRFYEKYPHKKQMEIYLDGGIRRGSDVIKALALGAKAVFIGRPIIWGLAAGGEHGIDKVFDILRSELTVAMKLVGATKVSEVDKNCIYNGKIDNAKF